MTGNVGRSLLEGAQAGQAMMSTPLDVMRLRQERYLRQQELDRQKAQLALQMAGEYGNALRDFPKYMQAINQSSNQPQAQNPLQNPIIQQRIQQQQQQAIGQAANNIEVKGDSDGLSFKGSAADVAMAAQHPVLGKIIRDAAAKNMQSSLPATSTQLAQPLTNPQSSKFQRFAQEQPQEAPETEQQAAPTPISPPTTAPMPPIQGGGQGEAIPEPDLSAVEKPDVTLPQGTTMSMPKTYKDFSQIPSNMFAASKEGVPAEKAGLTPTLLDFVKQQEGFSPKAYPDGAQTSVGYGTRAISPDEKISEPEAVQRLSNELLQSREAVMTAAQQKGLQLSPNQLDALTSFDYNTGAGSRIISQAKSVQDIPQLMAQFTRAGNEHLQGLANRRMAEIQMFNGGMNTTQAGLGGAPDFALGQNVAKAQEALNQNPFSKPDYTKMIPVGQEDNTLLQKSIALGIPYVEKTNVDTTPQDLRNQGIFGKNTELNQLAYAPKTHSITKWNDELPERQQKVNNLNKLLSELDEFQTINAREGTSPVKNILMEMSHNVTSDSDYQRLANLALNFYGATDKSGTQVRNFAEFTAFMKSMPNISNNPEANAKIIERIRAMTNRDLDRNDSEANYFSTHQTLDGFNQNWDKFNRDVPVMKGDKVNPNYRDYQGYFAKDALRKLGVNVPEENQTNQVHPQAQEALQWANAHPNDPRAAKIKQRLGY